MQKKLTYTLDGVINQRGGGGYIRNNIFVSKSDCQSVSKWMGLYPGDLRPGGGFNVGFYSMLNAISYLEYVAAHSMNFCRTGWALWLNWLCFFKQWIYISCKMTNTQTLASALRRIVGLLNECIPQWILETSTPVPRLLVNCRWSLLYGSVQIYWPAFFSWTVFHQLLVSGHCW